MWIHTGHVHWAYNTDAVGTMPYSSANLLTAGLKVNVWTVDKVEDFNRVKAMGVDYITTNARFPKEL